MPFLLLDFLTLLPIRLLLLVAAGEKMSPTFPPSSVPPPVESALTKIARIDLLELRNERCGFLRSAAKVRRLGWPSAIDARLTAPLACEDALRAKRLVRLRIESTEEMDGLRMLVGLSANETWDRAGRKDRRCWLLRGGKKDEVAARRWGGGYASYGWECSRSCWRLTFSLVVCRRPRLEGPASVSGDVSIMSGVINPRIGLSVNGSPPAPLCLIVLSISCRCLAPSGVGPSGRGMSGVASRFLPFFGLRVSLLLPLLSLWW